MEDWFTIDKIEADTYIISEYCHWEETHCYLLNGNMRSLLIDTGLAFPISMSTSFIGYRTGNLNSYVGSV